MSLQERLDEFRKSFESGAPPYNAPHEVIKTMHRATAELKATGIEERGLKVGDRAPSFSLFNQDRVQIDSADLLRQGPLVVSFFRGHWWPYCNMELEALQEIYSDVRALGAQIIVITPEIEPNPTETALGSHPCCVISVTYLRTHCFQGKGRWFEPCRKFPRLNQSSQRSGRTGEAPVIIGLDIDERRCCSKSKLEFWSKSSVQNCVRIPLVGPLGDLL